MHSTRLDCSHTIIPFYYHHHNYLEALHLLGVLDCWLQDPSFIQVFKKEWLQLIGLPFNRILKQWKVPLKKWNREVFGHIDHKIHALQNEIAKLNSQV